MKYSNPRIDRLRQLLELEERRDRLEKELDSVTQSMHALRDALFDESGKAAPASAGTSSRSTPTTGRRTASSEETSAPKTRGGGRRTRMKRGALKEQIFAALHAAGEAGVRVAELAKALATKPVNIHSWFHSALNRHPEIKKLQGGHYRLQGGAAAGKSSASSTPAKSSAESTGGKRGGRSARTVTAKRTSSGQRSGRGELSKQILGELQSAGAKGLSVRELAEKVSAPYKNIYVWFATTGKKNASVKKLGPAQYKLA